MVKNVPATWETWARSLGWEGTLEEGMATHSSIHAWRIPWTKEPGGLQSDSHKESDTTERLSTHVRDQNTVGAPGGGGGQECREGPGSEREWVRGLPGFAT